MLTCLHYLIFYISVTFCCSLLLCFSDKEMMDIIFLSIIMFSSVNMRALSFGMLMIKLLSAKMLLVDNNQTTFLVKVENNKKVNLEVSNQFYLQKG